MPKEVCISTFYISCFAPNRVKAPSGIYSSAILPICGGGKLIRDELIVASAGEIWPHFMPKEVCISTFYISCFAPNRVRASSGIYSSAILIICVGEKLIRDELL
jgi:hypothetical protein